MFNLKFELTNPWSDRFESIYCNGGRTPFKHKFWELQTLKSDDIISFDLRVSARCDHAGIDLWMGLLGYSINIKFYDSRHWDHNNDSWTIN